MSIVQGSITIASDGTASGSGAAKAIFDAYRPLIGDLSSVPVANQLQILRGAADLCTAFAALVPYITANAVINPGTLKAHVTTESLGNTPNPNNPATPIDPPASPVDVPLTGTGTVS